MSACNTQKFGTVKLSPIARLVLRDALYGDLQAILKIERESFWCPWTERDFREAGPAVVLEHHGQVVGYAVYCAVQQNDPRRPPEVAILNLAVQELYRHTGLARAMVQWLQRQIEGHPRYRKLSVVVSEHNSAAINFYRALGFRATDVLSQGFSLVPDGSQPEDGIRFIYCRQKRLHRILLGIEDHTDTKGIGWHGR